MLTAPDTRRRPSRERQVAGQEPESFHGALAFHMIKHGDTAYRLGKALSRAGRPIWPSMIRDWASGASVPSKPMRRLLEQLDARWDLPRGHLRARLPPPRRRDQTRHAVGSYREREALAVHLPADFEARPAREQREILAWVRRVVVRGTTDFRRYQLERLSAPYAIRFPSAHLADPEWVAARMGIRDPHRIASPRLAAEVDALMAFKTSLLSPGGEARSRRWKPITALNKGDHLGLWLGALAADPAGPNRGAGLSPEDLTLGLLVMQGAWKWFLDWRLQRRGFYTQFETNLLETAAGLVCPDYGWLPRNPSLAQALRPIPGLLTEEEVACAQADWGATCRQFRAYARQTLRDLRFAGRTHRERHEPILAVLEADSPVAEYDKIALEILREAPSEAAHPRAAAESARAFLMIRLSLHLGFRPKNIRQLLLCPRDRPHTAEGRLEAAQRGELRWSDRRQAWEVFVPLSAFKNEHSSFFDAQPFHLVLPDLGGLYAHIAAYIARHRPVLLRGADDPGTFFVKTTRLPRSHAAFTRNQYFEEWQWIIQRYGIFNPYTGKGAIRGLLPHGPSAVRSVLATHILKQTGSYEKASYAIHNTPQMIQKYYGRFLPGSKASMAAGIVNEVWR